MSGFEALLTGRVLADRYLVEKVIGRGGMGAVYRALDQRLGRPVALKVIMVPGADAATHERLRQRFLREAQSAAGLRHPHVVTVHDFGTDDTLGLDYLVMALLEGEDLASRTSGGRRLSAAAALAVVSQAASGLAAGHRRGLVHRDIKPGNLFLEVDEHGQAQVRILDFGIAQVAVDEVSLTMAGHGPLSPAYAAPEQLRGGTNLTPAADVFSLAAVALYLLTGERPFSGDASAQAADARAALARLDALPEVSPAVHDVLARALEMDPERRWTDANAFRRALETAHGPGLDALPASALGAAAGSAGDADDDVTLFAHERTLHADAGPPPSPPVAAPAAAPPSPAVAAGPVRAKAAAAPPARRSRIPALLVGGLGLVSSLALAGALANLRDKRTPDEPPVAAAPDSAALDSIARQSAADSIARVRRQQAMINAAVDSVRRADSIARENQRLAQPAEDTATTPPGGGNADDGGGPIYGLQDVDRLPEPRNMGDVRRYLSRNYPPNLRDSGVEGSAEVSFVVNTDGRPDMRTARVIGASHPEFEAPALRAVQRMRFRPAQVDGNDVRVQVTLPINFQVNR